MVIRVEFCYKSGGIRYYCCRFKDTLKAVKKEDLVSELLQHGASYDAKVSNTGDIVTLYGEPIEQLDIGEFLLGEELAAECEGALQLERRNVYFDVEDFCKNGSLRNKVGIVYGMRNTGKTIILHQLAGRPKHIGRSAYISLRYGAYDINHIYEWLDNLRRLNIKYVFIDEVTWAGGFIDHSEAFADRYANTMKLVLSGTDSLSLTFAEQEALYHRCIKVSTTPMSYPEYNRLTKGDILGFIRSGGVFWGTEPPTEVELEYYLRTSVVENIHRTIRGTERVKSMAGEVLLDLTVHELYTICYAVCQSITVEGMLANVYNLWGKKFMSGLQYALKACGIRITEIDRHKVMAFTREFAAETTKYDRLKVEAVIRLLRDIGFLLDVDIYTGVPPVRSSLVFAQTGVERGFIRNTLAGMYYSGVIDAERIEQALLSLEEKTDGALLESACMSAFKLCAGNSTDKIEVCKFREHGGSSREIDVVAVNHSKQVLHLVEVKRSSSAKHEFARHLVDTDLVQYLQNFFNTSSVTRTVVYRGQDVTERINGFDVDYRNIEKYLTLLEKNVIF